MNALTDTFKALPTPAMVTTANVFLTILAIAGIVTLWAMVAVLWVVAILAYVSFRFLVGMLTLMLLPFRW